MTRARAASFSLRVLSATIRSRIGATLTSFRQQIEEGFGNIAEMDEEYAALSLA
jgi:hypothetical protein